MPTSRPCSWKSGPPQKRESIVRLLARVKSSPLTRDTITPVT
jgi:hypothetical protein